MAKVTIGIGFALILLGLYGYFAVPVIDRSPTALIPTLFGALLAICGVLALDPAKRKHAMHAAAVVGVVGIIAPLGRIIPLAMKGTPPRGLSAFCLYSMLALCLLFVILCVRSFISARQARESRA